MDERASQAPTRSRTGIPTDSHVFELSGGALCLDFANTWEDRQREEEEHLHAYPDVLAFAVQTGIVDPGRASAMARRADGDPAAAGRAFAAARELRDAIYRLFSAVAAGREPPADGLERLNAILPEALAGARVERRGVGFEWAWADPADRLESPLRPIARSAADLLTSERLGRIRECDGRTCTWLFLDQSRNRSRRWCSMETCGNRAKVRRHYRRLRSGRE